MRERFQGSTKRGECGKMDQVMNEEIHLTEEKKERVMGEGSLLKGEPRKEVLEEYETAGEWNIV